MDVQSLYGKAISGVAQRAMKRGVPVYCMVGTLGDTPETLVSMGIAGIKEILPRAVSVEDSMKYASRYLEDMGEELAGELPAAL
jgi:glycerate kinase